MNILSKIKIHILFYLLLFICVLTGNFKECIIFTSFILVHELGHIISAIILKWNIEKIVVLPFGSITIFNEKINKPLKEELLIAISGVIYQTMFYFLLKNYCEVKNGQHIKLNKLFSASNKRQDFKI